MTLEVLLAFITLNSAKRSMMLSQFFGRESNNFFLYCCPLAFSELRIPVDLQGYFVVVPGAGIELC